MARVGFEPTISTGEWPKTYSFDRAATGAGSTYFLHPSKLFSTPHLVFFPFVVSMWLAWSLSLVIRTVTRSKMSFLLQCYMKEL